MTRLIVGLLLLVLALSALGIRRGLRLDLENRVRRVTGVRWPEGSEVVSIDSDSGLKSDHCEVTVRIPAAAREAFLAAHPQLKADGCRGNSPSAFWGGAAAGALCHEDAQVDEDASVNWRATFDPASGVLVERVDSFQ